jgi:hypothetical protein
MNDNAKRFVAPRIAGRCAAAAGRSTAAVTLTQLAPLVPTLA